MTDKERGDLALWQHLALERGRALKQIKYYLESHTFRPSYDEQPPPWYTNIKRILSEFNYILK